MRYLFIFFIFLILQAKSQQTDFCSLERNKCEGAFKKDRKEGYWKYYNKFKFCAVFNNGNEFMVMLEGAYKKGEKTGPWKHYRNDMACKSIVDFEGEFSGGLMDGIWKFYSQGKAGASVLIAEGEYDKGFRTGLWKINNNQGKLLMIGNYEAGIKQGEWTELSLRYRLYTKGKYVNGAKQGEWEILDGENGKVVGGGKYTNGLRDGKWREVIKFSETDEYVESGSFVRGKRNGAWEQYKNGSRMASQNYSSGNLTGDYIRYYPDNSIYYKCTYESGVRSGLYEEFYKGGGKKLSGEYMLEELPPDTIRKPIEMPFELVFDYVEFPDADLSNIDMRWVVSFESLGQREKDSLVNLLHGAKVAAEVVPKEPASVRNGEWVFYHENGQISKVGEYVPAIRIMRDIDPDTEEVVGMIEFYDHMQSGEWKYYNEQGELVKTENYVKGKLVK